MRRIDLWSVLKLALVLYTCLYVATLAALATIWAVALLDRHGRHSLQSFLGDVGLDNFRFYGDQMFRAVRRDRRCPGPGRHARSRC